MNTRLLENFKPLIPLLTFPFIFTMVAEQLPRSWRAKLSRARSSRRQIKLTKALLLPVGRYRRILPALTPALRTNQIPGFVTVPSWKKVNICYLPAGRSVSWKTVTSVLKMLPEAANCDLGLENAARGRRPSAAFSRPRSQFFTIRTDPKPVNNLFIFFLIWLKKI